MSDPYISNVVLLLHADGADASTVFLDSSTSAKTVTPAGNAQISTAQSKFGGASAKFDGTGDFITAPNGADFNMGAGDWTVEGWVYLASNAECSVMGKADAGFSNYSLLLYHSGGKFNIYIDNIYSIFGTTTISTNTWHHVAYCRVGSTVYFFLNGALEGTTAISGSLADVSSTFAVGTAGDSNQLFFNGFTDDIRVTKGVGRYTTGFTPPTEAYPNPASVPEIIGDITASVTTSTIMRATIHRSLVGAITSTLSPQATLEVTKPITAELDFITTSLSATWGARLDNISFTMPSVSSVMYPDGMNIEAGFIETTLESLTGANASFGFIDTSLSSTGTLTETINANLDFISTTLSASVTVDERITASFGFISSTLTALGGANASLTGPTFSFSSTVTVDNLRINANLGFLSTSLSATATMDGRINASFGFIDTYLSYNTITATGPVMSLSATMSSTITPAVAYVMNVHTTESTQYSNYPFLHIIHIGNKPYGVKADGLYLLEGADDNGTVINATMTTKETDFGSYNSKRVPYLYLNSDTATTVTPTVDGELSANAYSSSFGGRKVKIARGWNGRYWKFKVNNIQQLEGMEILPESLQRRIN